MERAYAEYAAHQAAELLAIDSPTGFTEQAAVWVQNAFQTLGYDARRTVKGGVLIDLGGSDEADGLLLEAHADTLGGMVAEIKGTGRLRLTALGGMRPENGEAENVRVYTRSGRVIEGTFQLCNASVHVNDDYAGTKRSYDTCEVVLDEDVKSASTPGPWVWRQATSSALSPAPALRPPAISRAGSWTISCPLVFCWAWASI